VKCKFEYLLENFIVPFTVLGYVRVETVTVTVTGFLDFEEITTVVITITPPA